MEKKTNVLIVIISVLVTLLYYPDVSFALPRAQLVRQMNTSLFMHNTSIYVPNFIATMENISSQLRTSAFGIAMRGVGPDACYGLAQCYGDLSLVDCVVCYAEARTLMPRYYPMTGGTVYLDGCFMRADNYSFYREYTGPTDQAICGNTTRGNAVFWQSARQALSQAVSAAPVNNGYARGRVVVSGTPNASAYVLANCWRTLDANSCRACLENASTRISRCLPWSEGRVINTGCFLRYSDTNFLNPIPSSGISRGTIIVIVVAVVSAVSVFIIGTAIGVYIWKRRIIEKKRQGNAQKLVKTLNDSSLNFKYSTLEKATSSFDEANKLGQGGFGTVYKGILPDGREIAVKRLFFNNKHRAADFYNEVNIISSVEHRNLVRLLGCSCSGPESLLVYEYLPNMSLDRFIFDSSKGKSLNWEKRFQIIIGTTEGLVYLHENNKSKIIHRDIKASNILLDSRHRAKIADFGLARSFQEDKSHISTAIAGTLGYMAPEYLAHGKLTEKADVYSYGVLLLEIVSGRENNRSKTTEYGDSLVTLAWKHFQEKTIEELIDPNLILQHDFENAKTEIRQIIHVGLLCCQEIPSLRPIMSSALQMLVTKEKCLPSPTNPPFMDDKTMELNNMTNSDSIPLQQGSIDSVASISHSMFIPR